MTRESLEASEVTRENLEASEVTRESLETSEVTRESLTPVRSPLPEGDTTKRPPVLRLSGYDVARDETQTNYTNYSCNQKTLLNHRGQEGK